MARIAVAAIRHASSSFLPTRATLQEFEAGSSQPPLACGAAVLPAIAGRNLALAGFAAEAESLGHTVVPLIWAAASASGPVQEDAFERVVALLLQELEAAGRIDAVALSLHGAMIATHIADADGQIAGRLRAMIGAAVPLVAMVDWHANVSPLLVMAATAIHAERSCPARGADATGRTAARGLDALLAAGPAPLRRSYRRLPFVLPLAAGAPDAMPAAGVLAVLVAAEAQSGIAHLALAAGFQGADVPHAGPAVLGYGSDAMAVERAVATVAAALTQARPAWRAAALDPAAAVASALAMPAGRGPVLLAEIDDDPDAGGTGDCMALAHALLAAGVPDAVVGFVYEPHVATIAHRAGVGAVLPLVLGAKHGLPGDAPLAGMFTVEALAQGPCACGGPIHAGATIDPGLLAVLRLEGLRLVVAAKRLAADDRQLFAHVGIPPESVPILAVKSALAYRADLAGLASAVIPLASVGAMPPDPAAMRFRHLRRGMAVS